MANVLDLFFTKNASLIDYMDNFILENEVANITHSIRPSALGYCLRSIVYALTNTPNKTKKTKSRAKLLRLFEDGRLRHERITRCWKEMGILEEEEMRLPKVDRANGIVDAIINLDGKEYVVEIKGTGSRGFSNLIKANKPQKPHLIQLGYYMLRLNTNNGILFYENRDTLAQKDFVVDPSCKDEALERITKVRTALDNKTLPAREYCVTSIYCKNCAYKKECWKDEKTPRR